MDKVLEKLQKFKQELQIEDANIIDISYYGKINLSKNDANFKNESKEDIYLVKKEVEGKEVLEFRTERGVLARVNENHEIVIDEKYKDLVNSKELLIQLNKVMPLSLEKMEKLQERGDISRNIDSKSKSANTKSKESKNIDSKDAVIDMNKRITEDKTFAGLVPEE